VAAVTIQVGQRYHSVEQVEAICLFSYRAPFTGGEKVTLPTGIELEIVSEPPLGATGANCTPIDYEKYEALLVPNNILADTAYDGYHLVVMFEQIENSFELVADAT
jgi:hypothetical protein